MELDGPKRWTRAPWWMRENAPCARWWGMATSPHSVANRAKAAPRLRDPDLVDPPAPRIVGDQLRLVAASLGRQLEQGGRGELPHLPELGLDGPSDGLGQRSLQPAPEEEIAVVLISEVW
jgi:hypothetical protein